MQPFISRQVLHVVARFRRPKQRTKRVASQTSSDGVSEPAFSQSPNGSNSDIRVLDDNFADQYQHEARDDRPRRQDKRRVMVRLDGGRRAFTQRRHQFFLWKGQATDTAVSTLRGCYTLARRELAAWKSRAKPPSAEHEGHGSASSDTKVSPRQHRLSSSQNSIVQKRPLPDPRNSAASNASIMSSQSSTTDVEEERHKDIHRSEYSLYTRRRSSEETNSSQYGFVETTSGSHERLLLVNALPLNDSEEEDEETSSTKRHLPFRTAILDGCIHILRNEWV